MFCFFGGGLGGNPEGDGLNHGNNPISTATIPPVEILEALYPVMFTQWALRPDSARAGRAIAAASARSTKSRRCAEGGAEVFLLGERGKFPPFGVNGGEPAALNRFVYRRPTTGEATPPLVSKITDVKHPPRPAGAAGNAGRRRLRRSADARSGARRARRAARLRLARRRRRATTGVVLAR